MSSLALCEEQGVVAGLEQEEVWTSPLPSWCSAPILRELLRDLRVSWAIFQPHGRMLCFLATTEFFFFNLSSVSFLHCVS